MKLQNKETFCCLDQRSYEESCQRVQCQVTVSSAQRILNSANSGDKRQKEGRIRCSEDDQQSECNEEAQVLNPSASLIII